MDPYHDSSGKFTTKGGVAQAAAKAAAPWGKHASSMTRDEAMREAKGISEKMTSASTTASERSSLKSRLDHLDAHHPGVKQAAFNHAVGNSDTVAGAAAKATAHPHVQKAAGQAGVTAVDRGPRNIHSELRRTDPERLEARKPAAIMAAKALSPGKFGTALSRPQLMKTPGFRPKKGPQQMAALIRERSAQQTRISKLPPD